MPKIILSALDVRDFFSPPGPQNGSGIDDTEVPVAGSFLDEAHPGPAPHNPEVVEDENDTPEESLAKAIIAAAREPDGPPLTDQLLLRETKNLAGCVSSVEVQTAAGHLLLGCGVQSALTGMLAVAEAIVLRLDEARREAEEHDDRIAFANAGEHVAEIRAALELPPFAVGQVWRTVNGREFVVETVSHVTFTAHARFTDGEEPRTAEFCLQRGIFHDQSVEPQPHTLIHNMPIVLVKAAPAVQPVDPKDKTWIDDDFDKPQTKE
jgi:hypothetical protein